MTNQDTKFVFGETFAGYSNQDFLNVVQPIATRLQMNNIPVSFFTGKAVLDAGCGCGRASFLMLKYGAKHVTCFDMAGKNLIVTERNLRTHGFSNFSLKEGQIDSLPYEGESFDLVWCNGVLHHMENTGKGLSELIRVLKVEGWLWLYLYGAGGIYWYLMDFFRDWFRDVDKQWLLKFLRALFSPVKVGEFMDNWCSPISKRYLATDVQGILEAQGFWVNRLERGMIYDTCMRNLLFPMNRGIMGEGDLRFLSQKKKAVPKVESLLRENNEYSQETKFFWGDHLKKLEVIEGREFQAIAAATLQLVLRDQIMGQMAPITNENVGSLKERIKFFSGL